MQVALYIFCLLSVVLADSEFGLRIREAQSLLLSDGPRLSTLALYDSLITDLEQTSPDLETKALANVYYNRALIEISVRKTQLAIDDLKHTLSLDPSLSYASEKLARLLFETGDFRGVRELIPREQHNLLYQDLEQYELSFEEAENYLESDYDKCLEISRDLASKTPSMVSIHQLHLKCAKGKLLAILGSDNGAVPALFSEIVQDYTNIIKNEAHPNAQVFAELAQYLLFSQVKFEDAWSAVKKGLRIDNEHKACGELSKTFSRLQKILTQLGKYAVLDEFLYPETEEVKVSDDKLADSVVDFTNMHPSLTEQLSLPKREVSKLPKAVRSNLGYLVMLARHFALQEFGDENLVSNLQFHQALMRFACEAAAQTGVTSSACKLIDEKHGLFFPKYAKEIDALIRNGKLNEAQRKLERFGENVKKTQAFRARWQPIEAHAQEQQRQRQQQQQQQFFRQQQQRQQQQQLQTSGFDTSKDYYKVLDIPKDADEKTIKKNYRAQTLKYHPDKYKGGDLSEAEMERKMQDINEAYEILSDEKKRQDYDSQRSGGARRQAGGSHHGGGSPFGNFNFGGGNFHFKF